MPIGEQALPIFSQFANELQQGAAAAGGDIGKMAQSFGDALGNLVNGLSEMLPQIATFAVEMVNGLVGGIAYFGIFLSSAWACMKMAFRMEGEKKVVVFGCGLAVAGYIFHNVLCYQQIIGTPFIFILMGIGAAKIRWDRRKK